MKRLIVIIHSVILMVGFRDNAISQNLGNLEVINNANYDPIIKEAVKLDERPEIVDTVKRIAKNNYSSPRIAYPVHYTATSIAPAKMLNEPLGKLYQSFIKAGAGNYNMPMAELYINSTRSRDLNWGMNYKFLSSHATFANMGSTDFSDNLLNLHATKFYKKHTLTGEFNYSRNVIHYYGFSDTAFKNVNPDSYRQVFQLFEGKTKLVSHYADTGKALNHEVRLNYYNYGDFYNTFENNILASGMISKYKDQAKFNLPVSADFYNLHSAHDTFNNAIIRVSPFVEGGSGKTWKADVGVNTAIDYFSGRTTKYYFYPRFNISYNIYQNMIVPYAGLSGGLDKNSFRSLSSFNPFVMSNLNYQNTNNKYNVFGGLRGVLSNRTSYDVKALYGRYDNMAFYLADYTQGSDNVLANKYKVIYMGTNFLNVNAQISYRFREKLRLMAKGNYYGYKTDSTGSLPWHKPNYDLTFSGFYNLKNKFVLRADVFVIGNQWALQGNIKNGVTTSQAVQLRGITDINLGIEYRYTKFLSAFINFNNIGNFSYYRWDKYPTQRFNAMVGLTFIPF